MIEINIWYTLSVFWLTGYIFTLGIAFGSDAKDIIDSWIGVVAALTFFIFIWPLAIHEFCKNR